MAQNDYILFSPIGSRDPIYNNYDGSMLHICRKYHPRYIRLFLTKEMAELHRADDRYCKCIRLLYEQLGLPVEIEVDERDDIDNPQRYDLFYDIFSEILNDMHAKYPDAELIVNIASGTPPMKSELKTLAMIKPYHVMAVQVETPEKKQNRKAEEYAVYDSVMQTEFDLDNHPEHEDRCVIPEERNFRAIFARDNIEKHIRAYDYQAAYREASEIKELIPQAVIETLEAAVKRIRSIPNALYNCLGREEAAQIMPSKVGPLAEYVLMLDVKYRRGDLADYIRGITPALYQLAVRHLVDNMRINIFRYCERRIRDGNEIFRLKRDLLQADEVGSKLLEIFDREYNIFKDSTLNSNSCIYIINELDTMGIGGRFTEMRRFEETMRNPLAHSITPVSDEIIKNAVGYDMSVAAKNMRELASAVLRLKPDDWSSYDRMNDYIIALLKQ